MSSIPQPLMYPQPLYTHPPSTSKGSFGPVFIVLAVITILAAMACFIGRLCAKRFSQQKTGQNRTHAAPDIELGFDPSALEGKHTSQGEKVAMKKAGLEFQFEMSNFDARLGGKGGTQAKPANREFAFKPNAHTEFAFKPNAPETMHKGRNISAESRIKTMPII